MENDGLFQATLLYIMIFKKIEIKDYTVIKYKEHETTRQRLYQIIKHLL